ncbi:MAG: hypothetical protein Q9226_000955 [Calogaya cf. arnoldii]
MSSLRPAGSSTKTLEQKLKMELELNRRAVLAGWVLPSPPVTAVEASIAARKERTLASLSPKARKAARRYMQEKERAALQLKREQFERQAPPVSTQGAARKRVAWADSEERVHFFESYKELLFDFSWQILTLGFSEEINRRYVPNYDVECRYAIDFENGWKCYSEHEGLKRIEAPGLSVNGYQSMSDDHKDSDDEEYLFDKNAETF